MLEIDSFSEIDKDGICGAPANMPDSIKEEHRKVHDSMHMAEQFAYANNFDNMHQLCRLIGISLILAQDAWARMWENSQEYMDLLAKSNFSNLNVNSSDIEKAKKSVLEQRGVLKAAVSSHRILFVHTANILLNMQRECSIDLQRTAAERLIASSDEIIKRTEKADRSVEVREACTQIEQMHLILGEASKKAG